MSLKRAIIDITDAIAHLKSLKEASLKINGVRWWKSGIMFDFKKAAKSKKGLLYIDISYIGPDGVKVIPEFRMFKEVNLGSVAPLLDEDVVKANAENPPFPVKKREGDSASMSIRKYINASSDTSVDIDESPENKSKYFEFIELINEAYEGEIVSRVDNGKELVNNASSFLRKKDKVPLEEFIESCGDIEPYPAIVDDSDLITIKKCYSSPEEIALLNNLMIFAPTIKVVSIIKEGKERVIRNPITTIKISFNKTTREITSKLYDMSSENKTEPVALMCEGEKITPENIHKVIKYGSSIDCAIITMTVCCSSMGISLPVTVASAAIMPNNNSNKDKDMFKALYGTPSHAAKSEPPSGAAAEEEPAAGEIPEDDAPYVDEE